MSINNRVPYNNYEEEYNEFDEYQGEETYEGYEEKSSAADTIKLILAVVLMLLFIIAMTTGILYLTNSGVKNFINTNITKISENNAERSAQRKAENAQKQAEKEAKKAEEAKNVSIEADNRVSELADYYLSLDTEEAATRLKSIKSDDKKIYERIFSSMDIMNPSKSQEIRSAITRSEEKSNVLQAEYDKMVTEKDAFDAANSGLYRSLGIRGAIDAVQSEIQNSMDYDKVAKILSNLPARDTAKILYFSNPAYLEGIEVRLPREYEMQVDKEMRIYSEFLRENASLAKVYNNMEEKSAAIELEDKKRFNTDQLAVIFSNMNYLNAAKILNEFQDQRKVTEILEKIKEVEDYQTEFEGSLSTVITDSLKVLKKYDEDVDILIKAYEKMAAADLAEIIDKLTTQPPAYKSYIIDSQRQFTISETDMTIKALKEMKPQLVADTLAVLKNTDRVNKAALISREIGIPEP